MFAVCHHRLLSALAFITVAFVLQLPGVAQQDSASEETSAATADAKAADAATVPEEEPLTPTPPTLPSLSEIEETLEAIGKDESLIEEERAAIVKQYEAARTQLQQLKADEELLEKLTAAAETAAERRQAMEKANENAIDLELSSFDDKTAFEELQALKSETEERLETLTQRAATIEETVRVRSEETKLLPQRIADLQKQISDLQSTPITAPEDANQALFQSQKLAQAAQLRASQTALLLSQQKKRSYEAEAPLLALSQERLQETIELVKQRLGALSQTLSQQKKEIVQRQIREVRDLIDNQPSPAGYQDNFQTTFLELIEKWPELIEASQRLEAQLLKQREVNQKLEADFANTSSNVETDLKTGRGLSRGVGLLLQIKKSQLPDLTKVYEEQTKLTVELEEVQETLTLIRMLQDELPEPQQLSDVSATTLAAKQKSILQQFANDAERLLKSTLIPYSVELSSLINTTIEYETLINQHLLWVRNQRSLTMSDLPMAWQAAVDLFRMEHLRELYAAVRLFLTRQTALVGVWLFALMLLFAARPWFSRAISLQAEETRKHTALNMRPTFDAMLATVMLSLPFSLAVGIPGQMLKHSGSEVSMVLAFGEALSMVAAMILPLEFLRQFIRPCGVAMAHFNWPTNATKPMRSIVFWMELGVLPLIFLWRLLSVSDPVRSGAGTSSLARLIFMALTIIASLLLWRLAHPRRGAMVVLIAENPGGWIDKLRWVWHPAIVAVPLGLAVLTFLGYTYSANQLAFRLYSTIWLFILISALFGLAMRWLTVSRRRLLLKQLKERGANNQGSTPAQGAPIEVTDDKQADISVINEQTRRLIVASMFFGILLGLYWIWNPVLPALGFLQRFELWTLTAADGTTDIVTLANILAALPILILTIILVRNAPGLLETALLQRLPLENAVRYAITTLTSYAIAGIGLVITASTLGLRWDSIQWLLAGLGVGLGFGLQEIFANFISGVILLFEQPIRVGDIVTLDGTTGVVSRIRMRATTITNWDRQEYVIPNRDFITGRFVNWTLTDTTNRVVIEVGIAYSADTRAACQILESICRDHPAVLSEPSSIITFEGFGDSTLNLVLRCYLANLDGRLTVIHEMHTMINDRFKAAGIEIAFPQRDLHVRSLPEGFPVVASDPQGPQPSPPPLA